MIRFGATLPPVFPVRMQTWLAAAMEWVGYDYLWLPDHIALPDFMPCPDPWTVMAAAATRTRRIVMGCHVSDPHRMHPAMMAHRVATLDQLSKGRTVIGLGSGESMNLDAFGIPWNKPLSRLKEAVSVLRGLLDTPDPFTFEGEFYRVRNARLTVHPYRRRRIPLYLAALGPKAKEFAGQVADGWAPTAIPAPFYREAFDPMRAAAVAAGRDLGTIDRTVSLVVALSDNPSAVLSVLKHHALGLVWPPVVERLSMDYRPPPQLADVHYATVNPFDAESLRRYEEHQSMIPAKVVEQFMVVGNVRRIRQVIGQYVDAGATHFVLTNASLDPTSTFTLANEILPYFRPRKAPFTVQVAAAVSGVLRRAGVVREADPQKGLEWLRQQNEAS